MIGFILYCSDQQASRDFYITFLESQPELDVPGMTEFRLAENVKLGLMPERGIARIITPALPHPSEGNGVPRCELYLYVEDLETACNRAINAGAKEISQAEERDWGDKVAYYADPDGHVLALAHRMSPVKLE